jgi:hypothetical protein
MIYQNLCQKGIGCKYIIYFTIVISSFSEKNHVKYTLIHLTFGSFQKCKLYAHLFIYICFGPVEEENIRLQIKLDFQ